MITVRSIAAVVSLFLVAGCAAQAGDEAGAEHVASSAQDLTLAPVPTIPSPQLNYVDPACVATVVSTGPAIRNEPNPYTCPAADPYVGQQRFAGFLEDGLTELLDTAQPGAIHCRQSPIVNGGTICTKDEDKLLEETCTASITYACPCGVEVVTLDSGARVGQCKRFK